MPGRSQHAAAAFASALALMLPFGAVASDGQSLRDRQTFLGLWEGIDPLDGSTVQVSITDVEGDGILEFVEREDFYTFCVRLGDNYSQGRGVITGQGTVVSEGVLEVETSFTCIGDDAEPATPVEGTFQFFLESRGRILREPGAPFDNPDIQFHRTAR